MLNVSMLKRSYGDFVAVESVSFSIQKGEIVGLLGHNGAGKTTIMKILSGYLEPNSGEIHFEGQAFAENTKFLQQKIGYLPENLPVYPEMIVADYLDYAAELKGISGNSKPAEIKRVLMATDISDKLLTPISTLSRGYKQRVGVAQALLGKPSLLILDEPTNGLDPTQTLQMRELIRTIAKEATVILSTHIMQEVDAICDRVLMMRSGRLVIDAKLVDLRQSQSILVAANTSPNLLQKAIDDMYGVAKTSITSARESFSQVRISLKANTDTQQLCAAIAKCLINQGADIYQLQPEVRDLEMLFREVNEQEVVDHAA